MHKALSIYQSKRTPPSTKQISTSHWRIPVLINPFGSEQTYLYYIQRNNNNINILSFFFNTSIDKDWHELCCCALRHTRTRTQTMLAVGTFRAYQNTKSINCNSPQITFISIGRFPRAENKYTHTHTLATNWCWVWSGILIGAYTK